MIKLHLRITWPALLLLLIALLVWLARDPGSHKSQRRVPVQPSRPPRRRVPLHRQSTDDFVIDQDGPAIGDYAAETERLDREAADRARTAYEETTRPYETIIERMNQRNAERRQRNPRR